MPDVDQGLTTKVKRDHLPGLSPGILHATTADGGVVYDLVTEQLSFLNPSGVALADACAQRADRHEHAVACAADTGVPIEKLFADIDAALETFRDAGFIGRSEHPPKIYLPDAPPAPLADDEHTTTQAAGVHRIRFRGRTAETITAIAEQMGLASADPPTADFHLVDDEEGSIRLRTDTEWSFGDRDELVERVVTVVNDFVARTTTDVVLHAAALRAPDGTVIVFPGAQGSGKSTLAGVLIQHGWTYLGDESATIRHTDLAVVPCAKPLELTAASCAAIGVLTEYAGHVDPRLVSSTAELGRVPSDPPTAIVTPHYVGPIGAGTTTASGFTDALVTLVGSALNLRYVGTPGLETLVALAATVPLHAITYATSAEAVTRLAELGFDSSPP